MFEYSPLVMAYFCSMRRVKAAQALLNSKHDDLEDEMQLVIVEHTYIASGLYALMSDAEQEQAMMERLKDGE